MSDGFVRLKPGKEKKVRNGYPWIQRGECQAFGVEDGAIASLLDADGKFVGRGTYNSRSRFQFRVFTTQDESIDAAFFRSRLQRAVALRESLLPGSRVRRVVYSEADLIPGLIVDQYEDTLVAQVRSLGIERLKGELVGPLMEATGATSLLERSDMAGREEEGLGDRVGPLAGEVPDTLDVTEDGLVFRVPIREGLKTGHYLDQRETRRRLAARTGSGDKVLDCFCYTGGFSLAAARSGALVYGVDSHETAIEVARHNARVNGVEAVFVKANAFDYLANDTLGPYDWIVLDPPAIAKTAEKRNSLKWAIWKLVHAALPLTKPGGRLIVCSCTYQLDLRELIETARLAANDRGYRMFLEDVTYQDVDHPILTQFPESLYLKCAWLRVEPGTQSNGRPTDR